MKTSIDHLPEHKHEELARVVEILHAEFEDALAESSADWKKSGCILKLILFGSYARECHPVNRLFCGSWKAQEHA